MRRALLLVLIALTLVHAATTAKRRGESTPLDPADVVDERETGNPPRNMALAPQSVDTISANEQKARLEDPDLDLKVQQKARTKAFSRRYPGEAHVGLPGCFSFPWCHQTPSNPPLELRPTSKQRLLPFQNFPGVDPPADYMDHAFDPEPLPAHLVHHKPTLTKRPSDSPNPYAPPPPEHSESSESSARATVASTTANVQGGIANAKALATNMQNNMEHATQLANRVGLGSQAAQLSNALGRGIGALNQGENAANEASRMANGEGSNLMQSALSRGMQTATATAQQHAGNSAVKQQALSTGMSMLNGENSSGAMQSTLNMGLSALKANRGLA